MGMGWGWRGGWGWGGAFRTGGYFHHHEREHDSDQSSKPRDIGTHWKALEDIASMIPVFLGLGSFERKQYIFKNLPK
jgi:hypothetical protein